MLNFGKYAAIAAAGLGLAALAAPSAEAHCGFVQTFGCGQVSSLGWGQSFGMYRPVTAYRPVTIYRPVYAYAYHRPSYGCSYQPSYGYSYQPSYGCARPSYGSAYGSAYGYAPVRRYYRPIASFRLYKPATYAWAVPHIRVYHRTYGAAYGYMPRYRPVHAYGCGY